MLKYSAEQAFRGIRRRPQLSVLVILVLGLGIGTAVAFHGVLQTMGGDPVPGRSGVLYYVKLNPTPLNYSDASGAAADNVTWPDANALLSDHRGTQQAAMAGGKVAVVDPAGTVSYKHARFTTPQFFEMFGRRLLAGRVWNAEEENVSQRVAVITDALAREQFGDTPTVGKTLVINDIPFRIIGVIKQWGPWPKFYADLPSSAFDEADDVFIPLHTALDIDADVSGRVASWGNASSADGMLESATASWLQYWVQLDTPAELEQYRSYLDSYARDQHARGTYERTKDTAEVVGLRDWLARKELIPDNLAIQLKLAYAFLLVCIVNASALLFSKFQAKERELAIRRSLGARRIHIVQPLLLESALLGLSGGIAAVVTAEIALWLIRRQPDDYSKLAHLDPGLVVGAALVGVAAGMLAAAVPAWRVAAAASIRRLI